MIIKFVFKNEIHRCSKVPADFPALLSALKLVFKETLPENFTLQYDDPDGDKIMLTSQEDYLAMMENEKDANTTIKIYVTPLGEGMTSSKIQIKVEKPNEQIKVEPKKEEPKPEEQLQKSVSMDGYSIITEKKNELEKVANGAELSASGLKFDPELEAKVNALVLMALKNNIGIVAGAVRENILESREVAKPVSSAALIDSLVYIQKLAQGVEGATAEQINKLDQAIKTAVENCRNILQVKPQAEPKKEEIKKEEPKKEEPKIEPKKEEPKVQLLLDAQFVKEVSQLPVEAKETDITLYKTVVIKNTGKEKFPPKTFIQCLNSNENSKIALPDLQPGKECTTVLLISSTNKVGKHVSRWGFKNEQADGKIIDFGKEFSVEYEIVGAKGEGKIAQFSMSFNEFLDKKPPVEEPKEYPKEVKEKAIQIKEVFPQYNIDDICEYILKAPEKTMDELFNDYMMIHNSILQ